MAGDGDWINEGLYVNIVALAVNNGDDPQDEDWPTGLPKSCEENVRRDQPEVHTSSSEFSVEVILKGFIARPKFGQNLIEKVRRLEAIKS